MISLRVLKNFLKSDVARRVKEVSRRAFSEKYLLYTNVTISLILSTTGDILEQQYEKYMGEIDSWQQRRSMRMGISGVAVGILCHYWYNFLDRRLPGRSLRTVVKKVLVDQIICSPLYISVFFMTLGVVEDKSVEETLNEIKQKAWKLYAAEWVVWPPAQMINFYWLPTKYRVLYDNTISLGYDVFTSQVKYRET